MLILNSLNEKTKLFLLAMFNSSKLCERELDLDLFKSVKKSGLLQSLEIHKAKFTDQRYKNMEKIINQIKGK